MNNLLMTDDFSNYISHVVAVSAYEIAPHLTRDTEAYLVDVLCTILSGWDQSTMDYAICTRLNEISNMPSKFTRAIEYKALGDAMMVKIGLFRNSFCDSIVSPLYVINGIRESLAQAVNIYKSFDMDKELIKKLSSVANQVIGATDVLASLSNEFFDYVEPNLIVNYEFYTSIESEYSKRILQKCGILPINDTSYQYYYKN